MKYEVMTEKHLVPVATMYAEAFNTPPWNDHWTIETAKQRFIHAMTSQGFLGLVAIESNTVCGVIMGNSEIYYNGLQFNIKEFCMSISKKGSDAASDLLLEFETYLKKMNIREIHLLASKSDETEAFYHDHEYKSWSNMIMMGKKIK